VQGLSKKTVSYMSKSIFSYTNRYVWGIRTSGLLLYRKHSQMLLREKSMFSMLILLWFLIHGSTKKRMAYTTSVKIFLLQT
jgi:hypothetical protein